MESIGKSLGRRLRKFREERGFSREKFSGLTSLSSTSIANIEGGIQWVGPEVLVTICEALAIEPAALFTDDVIRIEPTAAEAWEIVGKALQMSAKPDTLDPRVARILAAIENDPDLIDGLEIALASLDEEKPRSRGRR